MNRSRDGRKLRVVVLVDSLLNPGGGERLAVENARLLDPERFERTLCITRFDSEHRSKEPAASLIAGLERDGVRVIGLERLGKLSFRAWLPLVKLLREENVDVLHGHMFGSNVWAAILGGMCKVPAVVAHEHMWSYDGGRSRAVIDRQVIARSSDAFIAVSETGRDLMVSCEGLKPRDIVVIPNGIPAIEAPPRAGARERFGLAADDRAVGSVGHLRPEKAFEVLVEAAALLRERVPGVRVLIAGEGDEREMLEGLIRSRGLDGTVELVGAREDVAHLLAALDVAVCCSDFEGGPLSVMEYMRAGLPVVASRVGGLPELLGSEGAVFVPPRDGAALAGGIARILEDDALADRLGKAGLERQRAEYDIAVWARRLEELYDELV
jgi:glycosyltransferase involved in cell wall biosynthesis